MRRTEKSKSKRPELKARPLQMHAETAVVRSQSTPILCYAANG